MTATETESKTAEVTITEDEAALYDRQIRLWGLDAQKRLRASTVLLIGLKGVGAEIAKNIILSGVKSITLLDSSEVTEEDKGFQFLIDRRDIGKNRAESSVQRAQMLNSMVEVKVDTEASTSKPAAYFCQFNVVCATGCSLGELKRLDAICEEAGLMFYAGDVFGFYAFMFANLHKHDYSEEVVSFKNKGDGSSNGGGEPHAKKAKFEGEKETKTVKKTVEFTNLKDALNADWTTPLYLKKLKRNPPEAYFVMRVLQEFRNQTGRLPEVGSITEDTPLLQSIRSDLLSSMSVNATVVGDNFTDYCLSQFNPVCAVLGGVMSAEIIKAVSLKDAPINNFFFYNGLNGCGSVELIGPQ